MKCGELVGEGPGPCITEPDSWEEMQFGGLWAPVEGCNPDQYVFRAGFRVFDEHIKVSVVIENSCVEEFIFQLIAGAALIRLYQIQIRELLLRVFIKVFHIGMRGRTVEIEVIFLNILPM